MKDRLLWLSTNGEARRKAVNTAASRLLTSYRQQCQGTLQIHLPRLADSLGVEIRCVRGLQCGARLLPTTGGYVILVDERLPATRYRTAIAHELAHTLFYSTEEVIPKRLMPNSRAEEHFCFDVARYLLAPPWLLDAVGINELHDSRSIFSVLHEQLSLSRLTASRIMFQDYLLLHGVSGYWTKSGESWRLRRGSSCSSPHLDRISRKQLHNTALRWLDQKVHLGTSRRIYGTIFPDNRNAFVMVDCPWNINAVSVAPSLLKETFEPSYVQLKLELD